MPLKVLLKGDSHFGLISSGVRRNEEIEDIYRRIVTAAVEERVDLFVDLGDLFTSGKPSPEAYAMVVSNLAVLAAEGIPVLIVPGNHEVSYRADGTDALEPLRAFPWAGAGVHVPSAVEAWRPPGRPDVEVLCLPYVPEARVPEEYETAQDYYDRLARAWLTTSTVSYGPVERGQADSEGVVLRSAKSVSRPRYRLAAAHLNLAGARKAGGDAVVRDIDLQVPRDLIGKVPVFCGHLHAHQIVRAEAPPAVVVGSTQYVDFGEARDRKGYVIYEEQ